MSPMYDTMRVFHSSAATWPLAIKLTLHNIFRSKWGSFAYHIFISLNEYLTCLLLYSSVISMYSTSLFNHAIFTEEFIIIQLYEINVYIFPKLSLKMIQIYNIIKIWKSFSCQLSKNIISMKFNWGEWSSKTVIWSKSWKILRWV